MSTNILVFNGGDSGVTVGGETVEANKLKRLAAVSDADVASWAGHDGIAVGKAGSPHVKGVKSRLSTNLTGANNDVVLTAVEEGLDGDDITLALTDPGIVNASADIAVVDTDIVVTLATAGGTKSTLTTACAGSNNDLKYTAVAAGVGGDSIRVRYVDPGGATATLGVVVAGSDITVNLGRAASAITSTGTLIKAAIEAEPAAAALVTVANNTGNDGSGLVAAFAYTALSGGVAPAISTTASQLKTLINADEDASALVSCAFKAGNSGVGIVTALSETPLAGGVDQVAGSPSTLEGKPRRVIARLLKYASLK